jgi:sugar phosphate isomerase/epimerase
MCIEDHGDFYCSDLVKLCKQTPHLYIFLDTGNTYLIGEQPIPAFEAAAPYTIGTHFKDHTVRPNPDILHFEVSCCALGDGDVPLRECYKILMEKAPHPEKLAMMFEMFPAKGQEPQTQHNIADVSIQMNQGDVLGIVGES